MQEVPVRTISTGWLQILGYTLIIGILAVIIFYLLRSRIAGNRRVAAGDEIRIEDLDQRPMESDLDRLLREAVRNEDWRLAFRIQYLLVIRALHDTGRIIWKRKKTNHDYVRELGLHPLADDLHTESLQCLTGYGTDCGRWIIRGTWNTATNCSDSYNAWRQANEQRYRHSHRSRSDHCNRFRHLDGAEFQQP